jgi:hypothetical protein
MVRLEEAFKTVHKNRVIVHLFGQDVPFDSHDVAPVVDVARDRPVVVGVCKVRFLLLVVAQQTHCLNARQLRTWLLSETS